MRYFCIVVSLIINLTAVNAADLPPIDIDAVLSQAAAGHEENDQILATWSGTAAIKLINLVQSPPHLDEGHHLKDEMAQLFGSGDPVVLRQTVNVTFATDVDLDSTYSEYDYTENMVYMNVALDLDIDAASKVQSHRKTIRTPEHTVYVEEPYRSGQVRVDIPIRNGGVRLVKRISREEGDGMLLSDIFDPREAMYWFGSSSTEFIQYMKELHADGRKPVAITSIGDAESEAYALSWRIGEHDEYSHSCKLRKIGDRLLIVAAGIIYGDRDENIHIEVQYDLKDAVHLPVKRIRRHTNKDGIVNERIVTFLNSDVNIPIDAATFGYQKLDVEDGDVLYDDLENATTVYLNDSFVDPEQFAEVMRRAVTKDVSRNGGLRQCTTITYRNQH